MFVFGFLRADTSVLDSQVFPSYINREHTVMGTSALARLKERREQQRLGQEA